MKRLLLALLACAAAPAATITFNISYNFTTAVACSATVTTNCMVNFQVGYINAAGAFVSLGTAPLPPTLSGTVALPAVSVKMEGVYGTFQFASLVAAQDQNGKAILSPPFLAAGSVNVLPDPPTAMTVTATNP